MVGAGAILGIVTVVGFAAGVHVTLNQEMLQLVIYKGLATGTAGLIIVGSWLARAGKRAEGAEAEHVSLDNNPVRELGAGATPPKPVGNPDSVVVSPTPEHRL